MTSRYEGRGGLRYVWKQSPGLGKRRIMTERSRGRMLLTLLITFMKIGAFTFGGGYAMIALLENEFVTVRRWLTKEEFLDMVALAESTPGPIAINSATYIGYRAAGLPGSIISTIAVSLPSLVIIYIISLFFDSFLALKYVGYAFSGIKVCVVYLICSAGVRMFKSLKKDVLSCTLFGATLVAFILLSLSAVRFSAIFYVLIGGLAGITVFYARRLGERRADR